MLRYLIQVVENLLAFGILTSLLWAAVDREGGEHRKWRALWGCAAGTGAALILAVLRRTTTLISRGFFNLGILSFAIVFVVFYLLFLWEKPRKFLLNMSFLRKRPSLAEALPDYTSALLMGALLFYALPGIFLYPSEFVLAGESVISTDFLFKFIGFAAGLLVVVLSSAALYRAGKGVPLKLLKILLGIILPLAACNYLVVIVQFLLARRLIPMIRWVFRIIVAVVITISFFSTC